MTDTLHSIVRGQRVLKVAVIVLLIGLIGLTVSVYWQKDAEVGEAQEDAARSETKADAGEKSLEALCVSGVQAACDAVEALKELPDPDDPETQDDEIQDPEVQEPERQDAEVQDPDRNDPERQDGESQDPETQDDEVQDGEVQDAEVDDPDPDDPENQDPEVQDPEVDDPDPNSALTFAIRDECNPPAGEFVIDAGASWERNDGSLTLVLTCQSSPIPPGIARRRLQQ